MELGCWRKYLELCLLQLLPVIFFRLCVCVCLRVCLNTLLVHFARPNTKTRYSKCCNGEFEGRDFFIILYKVVALSQVRFCDDGGCTASNAKGYLFCTVMYPKTLKSMYGLLLSIPARREQRGAFPNVQSSGRQWSSW